MQRVVLQLSTSNPPTETRTHTYSASFANVAEVLKTKLNIARAADTYADRDTYTTHTHTVARGLRECVRAVNY